MTTIDFQQLSPEQKAELLKQASQEDLKAAVAAKDQQKDENRKAYKEMVNDAIPHFIQVIENASKMLSKVKFDIFDGLKFLLDQKAEAYSVKQGQQTHTFSDKKGNGITYGFRVNDGWDDTVNAGIDKIKEFLESLAKDDNSAKLVTAINKLLKKDAKGNLKSSRVLELRQLAEEWKDEQFVDAVGIIEKAYKPVRSAFFIEAWHTNSAGKKIYYPLSISAAEFPEGTDIESLFPIEEAETPVEPNTEDVA